MAAFAQFGSDLDRATQAQLNRGARLTELLKQPQYSPMPVEQQVVVLWAGTKGMIDDIALEDIKKFEQGLLAFVENAHPGLLDKIRERKKLDDELESELRSIVTEFKERFAAEARSASA
jgi:F-type H+-transporting ATPase subunit alpha